MASFSISKTTGLKFRLGTYVTPLRGPHEKPIRYLARQLTVMEVNLTAILPSLLKENTKILFRSIDWLTDREGMNYQGTV